MSINISIVFPIYSELTSLIDLKEKVKYVNNDLLSKLEIIVINDNSPFLLDKDIEKVIREIPSIIKKKYLKLPENKGPGYIRNLGITKSTTKKYIAFVDDDDFLNLQYLLFIANKSRTDIIISPINSKKSILWQDRIFKSNFIFWNLYFLGFVKTVAWNKLYMKSFLILINAKFSELSLFEDEKFIINLICSNIIRSYSFIDKPIVEVNKRLNSRSRSFKLRYLLIYLSVQFENLNFLIRHFPDQLLFWIVLFLPKSLISVLLSYIRSFYLRRFL
tara:strand:- start:7 stop:831 length:825 start_codon:yes stop_codon:yes gene_type:complete